MYILYKNISLNPSSDKVSNHLILWHIYIFYQSNQRPKNRARFINPTEENIHFVFTSWSRHGQSAERQTFFFWAPDIFKPCGFHPLFRSSFSSSNKLSAQFLLTNKKVKRTGCPKEDTYSTHDYDDSVHMLMSPLTCNNFMKRKYWKTDRCDAGVMSNS